MNISFNAQSPYSSLYQKASLMGQNLQQRPAGGASALPGKNNEANSLSKFTGKLTDEKTAVSQQMRQMIRGLKQDPYAGNTNNSTIRDKIDGFSKLSGSPDAAEDEESGSTENYNYKAIASKIQQAKTSISAGQAVLAAKRETLKLKSKMASGNGDPEELQLALTHAKRMEMVARKKKHHLELEELVENTQKRDERMNSQEDAARQMGSALVAAEEEKITEKEDAIFDEREEVLDAALEQMQEGGTAISDEELRQLNEMISEIGEEELKQLEETMEMLETMEVVDPHMSKEDLEELKRKHRASEEKALMKANMEYLKDMIKHELGKNAAMPGMGGGGSASFAGMSLYQNPGFSMPSMQVSASPSIDIQA